MVESLYNYPPIGRNRLFITSIDKWDYYIYFRETIGRTIFRRGPNIRGAEKTGKIFELNGRHAYGVEPNDNFVPLIAAHAERNNLWKEIEP